MNVVHNINHVHCQSIFYTALSLGSALSYRWYRNGGGARCAAMGKYCGGLRAGSGAYNAVAALFFRSVQSVVGFFLQRVHITGAFGETGKSLAGRHLFYRAVEA